MKTAKTKMTPTWYWRNSKMEIKVKTRESMIEQIGEAQVKKAEKEIKKSTALKIEFHRGSGVTARTYFVRMEEVK